MMELFCSIGNDYDSFESIEFKSGALFYKARGSLSSKTVTVSKEILTNLDTILNNHKWHSFIDPSIEANPTPGERHYKTREMFFLKVSHLSLEIKLFIDSIKEEAIQKLVNLFLSLFQELKKVVS
nr:hypothetical protein BHI3_23910 [Bacteriovorax sp. HI3]